ncbi:hypothetical protein MUK42_16730 [Musa troglodytarum]|uniref:Uncharacterized protein n=1 Tax=Musa troglodytarum TaxID=320322 RepID=A0A9E7EB32_9LILI|nr:hypothetical protein MUK42_16730 [Musa troglodytarum]
MASRTAVQEGARRAFRLRSRSEGMRLLPSRRLLCSLMAERDTSAGVISSSQPHYCRGTLLASPMPMSRGERGLPKQTNRAAVSGSHKRGTVRMKAAGHLSRRNSASELLLHLEEGDDSDVLLEGLLLQELDAEQGLLVLELLHQAERLGDVGQAGLHVGGGAGKVDAEGPGEGAPTTPSSARPTLARFSVSGRSIRSPARASSSPSTAEQLGDVGRAELRLGGGAGKVDAEGPGEGAYGLVIGGWMRRSLLALGGGFCEEDRRGASVSIRVG